MDSNEAQQVLLEVLQILENSGLDVYSLVEVKANNEYATGYPVIVKAFLGTVRKQQIYDLAKKHGLNVSEQTEGLILYKPKKAPFDCSTS